MADLEGATGHDPIKPYVPNTGNQTWTVERNEGDFINLSNRRQLIAQTIMPCQIDGLVSKETCL